MKTYLEFLNEGVDDPGIFKAVFLAGGPGSGKSYVAGKSVPKSMGLKLVNSDEIFEFLLKKHGIPMDMMKMSPKELEKTAQLRSKAKHLINKKQDLFLKGRLGLILDGTGKDFDKIAKERAKLKSIGYDTFMIFVNTSLDVAKARNLKRKRTVPEKVVVDSWNQVQNNIGKFQNLFGGSNFAIVDNNEVSQDEFLSTFKQIRKFVKAPLKSKLANDWIKAQKEGLKIG